MDCASSGHLGYAVELFTCSLTFFQICLLQNMQIDLVSENIVPWNYMPRCMEKMFTILS